MNTIWLHLLVVALPALAGVIGSKLYDVVKRLIDAVPPQFHTTVWGAFAVVAPLVLKYIPDFPQTLDGVNAHVLSSLVLLVASQFTHASKSKTPTPYPAP